MSSTGGALTLCACAVGVSMFYQVRNDRDPIPVMVIGGILTTVVVGIASVNEELGTTFAAVYFLAMFLSRGSEIIDWTTGIVNGQSTKPVKATTPVKKAAK